MALGEGKGEISKREEIRGRRGRQRMMLALGMTRPPCDVDGLCAQRLFGVCLLKIESMEKADDHNKPAHLMARNTSQGMTPFHFLCG